MAVEITRVQPQQRGSSLSTTERDIEVHVQRVTRRFGQCIAQVFSATPDGRPDPLGTGILLAVVGHRLLLTAAHVLDHGEDSSLYVGVNGGKTVELGGSAHTSGLPSSGRRQDDDVDVGAVELADETADRFPAQSYIMPSDLDVDDAADSSALYVVMGYPHRRTKRRPGLVLESKLHKYTARSRPELYPKVGRDEVTSIVLEFRRDRIRFEGERQTAPHPAGMSGGPVLRPQNIGTPLLAGVQIATLVGLFTDYPERDHVLIAPRISLWVAYLRTAIPHLQEHLPMPRRFRPVFGDQA